MSVGVGGVHFDVTIGHIADSIRNIDKLTKDLARLDSGIKNVITTTG